MTGTSDNKALVIGASGFLGSHVTRQLVADGVATRILVRTTSDTRATDDLDIERHYGSAFDPDVLRDALQGISTVYYCLLDPRSWLRDTTPLWQTNVHNLQGVLDVASRFPLKAFVYTSTLVTIGLNPDAPANENDAFNWADQAPEYVLTRLEGERCALAHAAQSGLPLVACNVANTFGPGDYAPTPQGQMLWDAATGKLPFYFDGGLVSVGIEDAARALILAAQHGTPGQRYIISERYVSMRELFALAARAGGRKPRHFRLPRPLVLGMAWSLEAITWLLRLDNRMAPSSIRLLTLITALDNSKARRELHWQPQPIEQSIEQAVRFFDRRNAHSEN